MAELGDQLRSEGDVAVTHAKALTTTLKQIRGQMLPAVMVMVAFIAGLGAAQAEVTIDIRQGNVKPIRVAITEFFGVNERESTLGRNIAQVISANLERSGLFEPIDPKAFTQTAASIQVRPRFNDWRIINTEALVNGAISVQPDGRLRVEFRIWDVAKEEHMLGKAYSSEQENWRRVAHIVSDAIYKRVTGENGYFDSRIVYIAESGSKQNRIKRLAIMDQDGANHKFLTDGSSLVLTPRFSPARQEITYLNYYRDKPKVYLFNIQTGRQEVLGAFEGMTFSPRFSPDGNSVVMSHAEQGNSEIYVMDLRTRAPRRVTDNPAIDTAPSFSPDGSQIVFESDRGGSQQIYVMNANGSNPHRISFKSGRYGTPVWSPRGDLIAFTKLSKGQFFIGVMRPDGSGERLLADGYHNEGPTWAPNGRVLMFFRQDRSGRARLYSVDLTGHNLREVITPGDASDPAWSPLNP